MTRLMSSDEIRRIIGNITQQAISVRWNRINDGDVAKFKGSDRRFIKRGTKHHPQWEMLDDAQTEMTPATQEPETAPEPEASVPAPIVTTIAPVPRSEFDRIREALQFIPIGGNPERWRVATMIRSELGDAGRDLWDEWRGDRGNDDAEPTWRSAGKDGSLKIGTLFREAKSAGWRDDGQRQKPTPEQLAERQRLAAERAAEQNAKDARQRTSTAKKATAIWKAATDPAGNPYLARKDVSPTETLREIGADAAAAILGDAPRCNRGLLAGRLLVVPVKQGDRLSTVELIDGDGRKAALVGKGTKSGGYWAAQPLPDSDGPETLQFFEGVATTLFGKQAAGDLSIATLSSGNMPAVAKIMRERYPTRLFVFGADLVKAAGEPDPHAIEAARAAGGLLAVPDFGAGREPGDTDFNDMARIFGIDAARKALATAQEPGKAEVQADDGNAPASDASPSEWPKPQPLGIRVVPEPYPMDALPLLIRNAVKEVAGFVKAPVPMVASSALAALSLVAQAHADVRRDEILSGPVSLFVMTIADSGERKSQADKMFTKPIQDYQDAQAEAAKTTLKDYRAALEAWEAKRGGIKERIRQLAKSEKPTASAESDLRDLEYDKPEPPRVPKLIREDATPEGLAKKLQKDWPSAGVVSNEAGIVFGAHGMGKESVMRNLALLNKLWDGGRYQSDRGDEERSRDVRGARLTMGLMIQESTLRTFFEASKGLARGTGFLARFLVAWPESTMGTRLYTPPVSGSPALSEFSRRITSLLNQPVPIDDDGILTPPVLPLAPEAKAAWIEYHDTIERELANGGELYDVKDVASKSADNAVRLAALFQMFEGAGGAIGVEAFEGASRITAWHLNEARRFFGELALPDELADAARLDSWLIEHCKQGRTHFVGKNHVRQHGPLRDGARLDAAIRELAELDRLRLTKDGKRMTIQINPALMGFATAISAISAISATEGGAS